MSNEQHSRIMENTEQSAAPEVKGQALNGELLQSLWGEHLFLIAVINDEQQCVLLMKEYNIMSCVLLNTRGDQR